MKKLITLAATLLYILTVTAQKIPLQNTNLWRVSGNGITESSFIYLTGKSCDQNLKLDEKSKDALNKVKTVIVEYDLYGSKDAGKLARANFATADSQKIKNNLSAGQVSAFENKLKDAGYPAQALPQLQAYKLNMIYYMLASVAGPCGTESQGLAYEIDLRSIAKKTNKEFAALQSIDDVLAESGKTDNYYWKKNISYLLDNEDKVKAQYKQEANLYQARDIKELQQLYNNNPLFMQLYKTDIQKQHVFFVADKIEQALKAGPGFFSIQFSNIVYSDFSVFEILAAKGYTITPVLN
ncbi:TraB/GumN family protein [Ferruginibacter sp. SUN106]|uniref:TraB/GumN family protein n=1 Tax=Ferruginibacter sp. SUN106 TaxID=2978348 RepID=UPI003D367570